MLNVTEIFASIQGESTLAGCPCVFVRLAGCNLRCAWCDTTYSHDEECAEKLSVDDVVKKIAQFNINLVEITGGEPLLQPDVVRLCDELLRKNYRVMIETNGSQDISIVPQNVRKIVDVKCPASGYGNSFLMSNINHITQNDEIKFVVASLDDAAWAKKFCGSNNIIQNCSVIFSPVTKTLSPASLAEWMVANCSDKFRLGLQLHKIIWGDRRGV